MTSRESFEIAVRMPFIAGQEKAALMQGLARGMGRAVGAGSKIMPALARGGGKAMGWLKAQPGALRGAYQEGLAGAPMWGNRVPKMMRPAENFAAPAAGAGGGGAAFRDFDPAAAAGARAQGAFQPPPMSPSGGGAGAPSGMGRSPASPGFGHNFFRGVGAKINEIPNDRLRGFLTGQAPDLASVGRRGTAIGAGVGYGGMMAAEAPGKMRQNEMADWQGEHPILAQLARLFGGMPEAHRRSYMLPNFVQGN